MASLLVTNDFPPKVGGIQSYLYELWRRLPADTTVLTTAFPGAATFDAAQSFRIERTRERVLWPTRRLAEHVDALAREIGARIVFLDPMLPVGLIGRRLRAAPFVVIAHGAEVTLPGRLPGTTGLSRRVLDGAAGVVAAGEYPARQATRVARRDLPVLVVPPGVDGERFRPLAPEQRGRVRERFGLDPGRPLVLGVSRLVQRKGFDVLIDAVAGLRRDVALALAGSGRDRRRLQRRARRLSNRVRFLGRVPEDELGPLYASADAFAMLCRDRWMGLEAEGFGIVFLEAASAGVPAVAGRSGGSHEAVVDGVTGFVVDPSHARHAQHALAQLLDDHELRARMATAARRRAVEQFAYDRLVERLVPLAGGDLAALRPLRDG